MKKLLTNLFVRGLILIPVLLSGCDVQADPPHLQDQQIVCTLKGEAYIFIEGYEKSIHSVRSEESDSLCQPMKSLIKVKPDLSMAPAYAPRASQ